MTDTELLNFYKEGIIPFEGEDEEAFLARAHYCHEIKTHLSAHLGSETPAFISDNKILLSPAQKFYGILPSWVPVIISNDKLLPWQGAAAWIFQLEDNSPLSALIQLRKKIWPLLGTKEELVTHEVSHIGRMGYQEKEYEEMIAYSSSPNAFRRFFGPLFRSNFESIFFVSLLILVIVLDFALIMTDSLAWYDQFMSLKLVPLAYLAFLIIRLILQQIRFKKAAKNLGSPALLYLLMDGEINQFAKTSPEEIKAYLIEGKDLSLRRHLLYLLSDSFA